MNEYKKTLWRKHYPMGMVVSFRNGEKCLEFVTDAQLAQIMDTKKYFLNGHRVAMVLAETHCIQSAWPLALLDVEKKKQPTFIYKQGDLSFDTCIVNGRWETLLMGQTYVHAGLFSAALFHWAMVQTTVRPTINRERLLEFAVALHEALGEAADKLAADLENQAAIQDRNDVLRQTQHCPVQVGMKLMMDNTFQAGLNALDPEAPCFVEDKAIRKVIFRGLLAIISQYRAEDALDDMGDEELFEDIEDDDAPYATIDDYIEDGMHPKQKRVPVRRSVQK